MIFIPETLRFCELPTPTRKGSVGFKSVVVRQVRKVGLTIKITVEHPDGRFLCLPTEETTLEYPTSGVMRADIIRLLERTK
jgi:hypothetical protein